MYMCIVHVAIENINPSHYGIINFPFPVMFVRWSPLVSGITSRESLRSGLVTVWVLQWLSSTLKDELLDAWYMTKPGVLDEPGGGSVTFLITLAFFIS